MFTSYCVVAVKMYFRDITWHLRVLLFRHFPRQISSLEAGRSWGGC